MNTPERFLQKIRETFHIYLRYGCRSKKKTDYLHTWLAEDIQDSLPGCQVKIEQPVPSRNAKGTKNCDIVAFKDGSPAFIFPVKFIMTNYKQNKNNGWENLTGETLHLHWANPDVHIIPINIIFNKVPYCEKSSCIKHFEEINYNDSYKINEYLVDNGIASQIVNYIIDVEHRCEIGNPYNSCPQILRFNEDTPFRSFHRILRSRAPGPIQPRPQPPLDPRIRALNNFEEFHGRPATLLEVEDSSAGIDGWA
uniref:Uncharacterized protein n=1 Tax=viral metagenome TaxID=1070528 RepID=A0A6C0L410_9ZZZZ